MDTRSAERNAMLVPGRLSRRRVLAKAGGGLAAGILTAAGLRSAAPAKDATPEASTPVTSNVDLAGVTPLPLTGARLAAFEAYIAAKLADLGVPGASVTVVQGGEVVFLQGFGVRELGRPAPVTADTMLRLGSVTKSFSSLLAATLIDAGRLSWETPLVDLLPEFAVADPELTPRLTIADSFSAATGLPRRDWEIVLNAHALTPEIIVASMEQLPLTAPYGEKYQYSNQMVAAGAWAAAVADGGSSTDLADAYATSLRSRVLHPIGMEASTLSLEEAVAGNDYAAPHGADINGSLSAVPLMADDTWVVSVAPSGGLWSNAREMARYVQTELNRGLSPNGGRLVSAANLERTWVPGVPIGESGGHYGLGWVISEYGGQRMVFHGGATLGFHSMVMLLPDADLGVVVLTNASVGVASPFTRAVGFRLLELLFDQPETFGAQEETGLAVASQERDTLLAQLGEIDSASVTSFQGRYTNPDLGEAMLTLREGTLEFDASGLRSALRPQVDAEGAVAGYLFVDPPLAFSPPQLTVIFDRDAAGGPRLVLKVSDEPGAPDLLYPYEPVGDA